MAFATETQTRGVSAGIVDRVSTFFREMSAFNAQYRMYRKTVRELSGLSDRELADLGLHRSMIADTAREATYGKQEY